MWHSFEFNRGFQEFIHLLFDRVGGAGSCKASGVINTSDVDVSRVPTGEAPHVIELWIENIGLMSFVTDAIVNDKLQHDLLGVIAHISQILAVATDNLSVSIQPLFDSSSAIR